MPRRFATSGRIGSMHPTLCLYSVRVRIVDIDILQLNNTPVYHSLKGKPARQTADYSQPTRFADYLCLAGSTPSTLDLPVMHFMHRLILGLSHGHNVHRPVASLK